MERANKTLVLHSYSFIVYFTCAQFISELYMSVHHGDGYEVLHLHFLPAAEEHQAVSLLRLEFQLNMQVIVDVGQGRIGNVRLLTIKLWSGH